MLQLLLLLVLVSTSAVLPSQVFKEGGESGLASGLASAGTAGQDELPNLSRFALRSSLAFVNSAYVL